jgi:high-affinity Fe2+/Pb2+ permease
MWTKQVLHLAGFFLHCWFGDFDLTQYNLLETILPLFLSWGGGYVLISTGWTHFWTEMFSWSTGSLVGPSSLTRGRGQFFLVSIIHHYTMECFFHSSKNCGTYLSKSFPFC